MKNKFVLISILVLFTTILSVNAAFDFYGYTYNTTKGALNATNVTIEVYTMSGGPPTLNSTHSSLSNASGWFNVSNITEDDDLFYKPIVRHYNGTNADYVGQSLPEFSGREFLDLDSINFYLKEGATINITAVNLTGSTVPFKYMVKDVKLGYPITHEFNSYVTQATVYLPADRNYSIMLYPNESFPVSYDLNNISDYTSPKHVDILFNTSTSLVRVSGYVNCSEAAGFDDLKTIAYLLEPGNMVFQDHPMPYNMSAWNCPTGPGSCESDIWTSNGFYNITLPGAAMGADIMLFATARNGTNYYGAFKNITLNYGDSPQMINFTLLELLGTAANITLDDASGGTIKVTTKKLSFEVWNSSGQDVTSSVFLEAEVDYSALYTDGPIFSWMEDVPQSETGAAFTLPMLNASMKEMNIFCPDYAPQKISKTAEQMRVIPPIVINLSSFNPGAMPGEEGFIDLFIDLLQSNTQCDVPYPNRTLCSLVPNNETEMAQFNPLSVIMGGGKISFKMRKNSNNITVLYKNVDMLASGPPDVLFDSSSNESATGSALEAAWRFGSQGPEIYDEILVGIPYDEADVDESAPITVLLDKLYDASWNVIWNATAHPNGENYSDVANGDYADFNSRWFNATLGGMNCSLTNTNADCYVNTTYNMIWITIPHFSGIGPAVKSVIKGNVSLNTTATDFDCTNDCTVYINVTNGNYTLSQNLQNITINNSETTGNVINFSIYKYNSSDWVLNGTNSTTHTNYNFTLYNGSPETVHRYKVIINKSTTATTVWNFTYNVSGMSEAMSLQLNLNCVESWTYSDWSTCSGGTQTRTATDANDCGTTADRLTLIQSCTVSTTGGGTTITKTTIGTEPKTVTLDMTDKAVFTVNDKKHYAQIKKIYTNYVTVTVRSDSIDIDLYINKTEKVDVDDDGVYDLEMTLEKIYTSSAKITFETIEEKVPEVVPEEEALPVEEAPPAEEVPVEEAPPAEEPVLTGAAVAPPEAKPSRAWIVWLIVAIVIVIAVAYFMKRPRKKAQSFGF